MRTALVARRVPGAVDTFDAVPAPQPEKFRHVRMVGPSMLPTFEPNQVLLVNLADRAPSPPGCFLVWDGLGELIQRVQVVIGSHPLRVRIWSDNPTYNQSFECPAGEAHILGRVVGVWVET